MAEMHMYFYTLAYVPWRNSSQCFCWSGHIEIWWLQICLCFSKPIGRLQRSGFGANKRADVLNVLTDLSPDKQGHIRRWKSTTDVKPTFSNHVHTQRQSRLNHSILKDTIFKQYPKSLFQCEATWVFFLPLVLAITLISNNNIIPTEVIAGIWECRSIAKKKPDGSRNISKQITRQI